MKEKDLPLSNLDNSLKINLVASISQPISQQNVEPLALESSFVSNSRKVIPQSNELPDLESSSSSSLREIIHHSNELPAPKSSFSLSSGGEIIHRSNELPALESSSYSSLKEVIYQNREVFNQIKTANPLSNPSASSSKEETNWFNVPGVRDNNCMLHSIVIPFLLNNLKNQDHLRDKVKVLFGEVSEEKFQSLNHFLWTLDLRNSSLVPGLQDSEIWGELVKELRRGILQYAKSNKALIENSMRWDLGYDNPEILQVEYNSLIDEIFLEQDYFQENKQLELGHALTLSEMLNVPINLTACFDKTINLTLNETQNQEAVTIKLKGNHYNFGLSDEKIQSIRKNQEEMISNAYEELSLKGFCDRFSLSPKAIEGLVVDFLYESNHDTKKNDIVVLVQKENKNHHILKYKEKNQRKTNFKSTNDLIESLLEVIEVIKQRGLQLDARALRLCIANKLKSEGGMSQKKKNWSEISNVLDRFIYKESKEKDNTDFTNLEDFLNKKRSKNLSKMRLLDGTEKELVKRVLWEYQNPSLNYEEEKEKENKYRLEKREQLREKLNQRFEPVSKFYEKKNSTSKSSKVLNEVMRGLGELASVNGHLAARSSYRKEHEDQERIGQKEHKEYLESRYKKEYGNTESQNRIARFDHDMRVFEYKRAMRSLVTKREADLQSQIKGQKSTHSYLGARVELECIRYKVGVGISNMATVQVNDIPGKVLVTQKQADASPDVRLLLDGAIESKQNPRLALPAPPSASKKTKSKGKAQKKSL